MNINMIKSAAIYCSIILLTTIVTSVNAQKKQETPSNTNITGAASKHKRELVYLYASNGGMIGYFSDGSVVDCPRCDFCRSNILAMFNTKPRGKWNMKKPDDFVSYEEDNGWVLINYKWKEKVPQF